MKVKIVPPKQTMKVKIVPPKTKAEVSLTPTEEWSDTAKESIKQRATEYNSIRGHV